MKRTIIAIVGNAGVGKDTVARIMKDVYGCNVICSYTTRPMREGETEGVEHLFVEICDDMPKMAYTMYGGYEYWTNDNQFTTDRPNVYVIDEKGLKELKRNNIGALSPWNIIPVYISAYHTTRKRRGVTNNRMARDAEREHLPLCFYDFVIENNGTIEKLQDEVKKVYEKISGLYG